MFDWICARAFEHSLNRRVLDTNRKFFWGRASPHINLAASFDEKNVREKLPPYALAGDYFVLSSRAVANCRRVSALVPNGSNASIAAQVSFC